ncbi:hypothetical protein [Catellatospora coxensis]|uniref:hypothetical protein n=1 Tax=Catellatospora coxensis TaxID=310354 RepID=UPI001943F31E|nr:hypothetical protein [Catellatospora coxensis]
MTGHRDDFSLGIRDDEPPTTAALRRILGEAAEVVIVEASPYNLDKPDAERITVSGAEIGELAELLAIVDGGTGDRCRCLGSPTILVRDAAGRDIAQWTLHHQTGLRGIGDSDADLRDGPALTDWLAEHGLTGPREIQRMLAEYAAQEEVRRVAWVRAAPPGLTEAAEAASRREDDDAEERLAELTAVRFPDAAERIAVLLAWAGFTPHAPPVPGGGTPWHELAPRRMLLQEPAEAIFEVLAAAPPTPAQLDGAAELFTDLDWKGRPDPPEPLRSVLIAHVTATGTDPMRTRMGWGYGRAG